MADGSTGFEVGTVNAGKLIDAEQTTNLTGVTVLQQRVRIVNTSPLAVAIASGGSDASAANQVQQILQEGGLNETAPATDTASSGLNGRLQRIAQRLSSLIALLPVSLGIKTSASSLSVAPASDGVFLVQTSPAVLTDRSGLITAGGTAQTIAAANPSRRGFSIQNQSIADLWFNVGSTAIASQPSIKLPATGLYETPLAGGGAGAISIFGATTGQAFAAREW